MSEQSSSSHGFKFTVVSRAKLLVLGLAVEFVPWRGTQGMRGLSLGTLTHHSIISTAEAGGAAVLSLRAAGYALLPAEVLGTWCVSPWHRTPAGCPLGGAGRLLTGQHPYVPGSHLSLRCAGAETALTNVFCVLGAR